MKRIDRREVIKNFLRSITLFCGVGGFLSACRGSPGNPNVQPVAPMSAFGANCLNNGTSVEILDNHGHRMSVSIQDIMMGTSRSYDIQGTALHSHIVTLTAEDFTGLRNNLGVAENSTVDVGHFHTVNVVCI